MLCCIAVTGSTAHAQQTFNFVVFDGGKYQGEQLRWASSNPAIGSGVMLQKDGWIAIPKSADGHYHLAATINGFPVTFLVDTGASQTFVGQDIARNAGIRAGLTEKVQTANGPMEVAATEGNRMVIGPYTLSDVRVSVGLSQKGISTPLLGMDVLKRFRIVQEQNTLMLQPVSAKK